MAKNSSPIYLGDGVYAEFDGYHILLRVNSHLNPVAVLESEAMESLYMYYKKCWRNLNICPQCEGTGKIKSTGGV